MKGIDYNKIEDLIETLLEEDYEYMKQHDRHSPEMYQNLALDHKLSAIRYFKERL